jgi:hypothetical protein
MISELDSNFLTIFFAALKTSKCMFLSLVHVWLLRVSLSSLAETKNAAMNIAMMAVLQRGQLKSSSSRKNIPDKPLATSSALGASSTMSTSAPIPLSSSPSLSKLTCELFCTLNFLVHCQVHRLNSNPLLWVLEAKLRVREMPLNLNLSLQNDPL